MKPAQSLAWIAAAGLAAAVAAGCERGTSAESAGRKIDQAAQRAEQKLDRAAADIKQQAEKASEVAGDAAITAKVKAAMIGEPELKATLINVDTADGVVTLTGSVDDPRNRERATQVAKSVEGVKSVDNRLSVKASSG